MSYESTAIKIGILGLGRTGISIFKFLRNLTKGNAQGYSVLGIDEDATTLAKHGLVAEAKFPKQYIVSWDDRLDHRPLVEGVIDAEYIADLNITSLDAPIWQDLDVVFISPGIPSEHRIFQIAKDNNILISSDIELFILNNRYADFVFVTGTNGKSTTVSLISHILDGLDSPINPRPLAHDLNEVSSSEVSLNADHLNIRHLNTRYILGGNIGRPVLEIEQGARGYILELSSFQIDLLPQEVISRQFDKTRLFGYIRSLIVKADNTSNLSRPSTHTPKTISVLLNITPDHLDRHKTMEEYIRVKKKILGHDGVKIISIDHVITAEIYAQLRQQIAHDKQSQSHLMAVSTSADFYNTDYVISLGNHPESKLKLLLVDNVFGHKEYTTKEFTYLRGRHNLENILAAFAATRSLGIGVSDIFLSIESFKGLKHRMQLCGQKIYLSNQHLVIKFYNDSKATNSDSASKSIAALENVFWLAGGIFKEAKLDLGKSVSNIQKAYLYGRDKDVIASYIKGLVEYDIFENLQEAFSAAFRDAKAYGKDTPRVSTCSGGKHQELALVCNILLAPACASFDQFKNFEDRGERFIELVEGIIHDPYGA